MSKILLFHDTFLMKGGAERMNIEIAKILHADIATSVWSDACYNVDEMQFHGKKIQLWPEFRKGMIGFLMMKWKFFRASELFQGYDTILFSNEAISGIWNIKKGTHRTYYYAHSISRHLFDLFDQYIEKVPWIMRIPYRFIAYILRRIYILEVQRVDVILVNSRKNKERMKVWFGRDDAIVLSPPVDTHHFSPLAHHTLPESENIQIFGKYFLSFSRLTHAKRIDVIIRAFREMPDQQLLIIYNEHDSQKREFMNLAKGFDNIHFHKLSQNSLLPQIITGAIATIAISREEDFGMVVIESMACGIPVIATDEGGFQEIVTDGVTGKLITVDEKDGSIETSLREVIYSTDHSEWHSMKTSCISKAKMYSLELFSSRIHDIFSLE